MTYDGSCQSVVKAKAKTAHSFMQRLGLLTLDSVAGVSYRPIPLAPLAVADGSARTMLRSVAFPFWVQRLTKHALTKADIASHQRPVTTTPETPSAITPTGQGPFWGTSINTNILYTFTGT